MVNRNDKRVIASASLVLVLLGACSDDPPPAPPARGGSDTAASATDPAAPPSNAPGASTADQAPPEPPDPSHCSPYANYDGLCAERTGLLHGYLCSAEYLAEGRMPAGCKSANFATGVCCP